MSENRPFSNRWVHSYNGRFIGQPEVSPQIPSMLGGVSVATTATAPPSTASTTTTATTMTTTGFSGSMTISSNANNDQNAEGSIGKPGKKRTRASRKSPTAVFNTDTTNFRAMVQQFTGAPTDPSVSGPGTGPPVISFGFGAQDPHQGMFVPPSQPRLSLQQLQQHQQLLLLQGDGQSMFSLSSNARPNMEISGSSLESTSSYGLSGPTSNISSNSLHFATEDRFRPQR